MVPHEGEPAAGPWRLVSWDELARVPLDAAGRHADRPAVLGVGGRSSSGKTTLAARLAGVVAGAVVVHTDNIAWRQAVLDWDQLLRGGVLEPARPGQPVSYRPPKWDEHGRAGAVVVPAGSRALIVQGVGATRQALAPLLDATVWVQADASALGQRNQARVRAARSARLTIERGWSRRTRSCSPTAPESGPPSSRHCRTTPRSGARRGSARARTRGRRSASASRRLDGDHRGVVD
jgi:hypothetical protein